MRRFKQMVAAIAGTAATATAAVAMFGHAGPAQAGPPVTATATAEATAVRAGPDTASAVRTRLPLGTPVTVECQTVGSLAEVPGFEPSALWDYLPAYNGWVSDVLIQSEGVVAACTKPAGSAGLLARAREVASTRVDIRFNPFALRYGDQCTFYAESRMAQQTGKFMPVYGRAYQWAAQAKLGGWTVGNTAAVNSVAVFPKNAFGSPYGHVGWVTEVKAGQVRIQDYNWTGVGATVTDHWVRIVPGTQFIYADR